jgi:hypothetical protein
MKLPIPWIVATVAVVVAGSAFVGGDDNRSENDSHRSAPQAAQGAARQADVDALRREVALLRSALADLRSAPVRTDTSVARAAAAAPTQAYNARPDRAADIVSQAEQEQQVQDHITQVATGFSSEARDQRWSNETGISLESALASDELKALSVRNIDCRSKTCRVEVEDNGSAAASGALPLLALRMAGTLPNIVSQHVDGANGRATVVMYMSRE